MIIDALRVLLPFLTAKGANRAFLLGNIADLDREDLTGRLGANTASLPYAAEIPRTYIVTLALVRPRLQQNVLSGGLYQNHTTVSGNVGLADQATPEATHRSATSHNLYIFPPRSPDQTLTRVLP